MKDDLKALFFYDAKKGAGKICGEHCICSYKQCSFPSKRKTLPDSEKGDLCPLKEYGVKESLPEVQNPFISVKRMSFDVSKEEIFALCALCDHSKISVKSRETLLDLDGCFVDHCIACPVNLVRDNMTDAENDYEYHYL